MALELVNTAYAEHGQPRDALSSTKDLGDWLAYNAPHFPDHSVPRLKTFRQLRDALRELFVARIEGRRPSAQALRVVNMLSARAPTSVKLDWAERPSRRTLELGEPAQLGPAVVARSAVELLSSADADRLSQCSGPGCVLLFLRDRGRREWCSAACGNRARVARHYRRHRTKA